jgi:hypothetical protein
MSMFLVTGTSAQTAVGNDRLAQTSHSVQLCRPMAVPSLTNASLFIRCFWFLGFYSASLLTINGLMLGLYWLLGMM